MTSLRERIGPADALGFPGLYTVPAFVNAHTHLELSGQKGYAEPCPPDFPSWVEQIISKVTAKGLGPDDYVKGYRKGLAESVRAGSAVILDHCRRAEFLLPHLGDFPCRVETALEFSGFEDDVAAEALEEVLRVRKMHAGAIAALSPVGPHSISMPLYRRVIEATRRRNLLLCSHIAETPEEVEFTRFGTGPFVEYMVRYKPRDVSRWTVPGCTPVEMMDRLGGLGPRTVAVHCNVLTDRDVEILARTRTNVVHCPGSCRFFGHTTFRLRDLLSAGVNVCLGTDSLASNETLSVLDAMRQLRQEHAWLSDEEIFGLGTLSGHRTLAGGGEPDIPEHDFCVFPWSGGEPPKDPTPEAALADLLRGEEEPAVVIMGGREVFRR
jgi:cytosine/adenosine deaminase-related metal-dependent hydrolase